MVFACGLVDVASWFHQKPLLLVHDNVPLLGTDVRTTTRISITISSEDTELLTCR